jgi:glucose/mannose transport system substrate-binding protein
MRGRALVLTTLLGSMAAVIASAAVPTAATPTKAAERRVTLLHSWESPSELAALNALGDLFRRLNPDIPLKVSYSGSHGGGAGLFSMVGTAAAARSPYDAVLVNLGAPLRPYFGAGLLSPVDEVWKAEGLERVIPPLMQAMSKINGHYYALPIGVHRNNLIWYDKRILDKHGIDARTLTTWDAFFEAAEKLKGGGLSHPLQLGVSWTLSVSFESIMAAEGAATYEEWINGKITSPDDRRLVDAFGVLKRYLSYVAPEHATTTWDAAIQRVIRGEAAFCIMGDWASGEFRLAKLTYGKDYGAMPVPGTQGMYGADVDAFIQSAGTVNPSYSYQLMRVAASRDGQDAFNSSKGSISPRTDTDLRRYDPYQRSAISDFKSAKVIYPNIVGATHDAFKLGLDNVMSGFDADLDVRKAAAAVAALAARSQNKFSHVWSLK